MKQENDNEFFDTVSQIKKDREKWKQERYLQDLNLESMLSEELAKEIDREIIEHLKGYVDGYTDGL